MWKRWWAGNGGEEIWLARPGVPPPESAEILSADAASWLLSDLFASDLGGVVEHGGEFTDICASLLGARGLRSATAEALVRDALRTGALRVYRLRPGEGTLTRREAEVESPAEQLVNDKKTFIVIELVDETDGKPVPFKKYRIELPDQSVREGLLDANGRARIVGIDPGTCKVSFPQFHAEDWRRA